MVGWALVKPYGLPQAGAFAIPVLLAAWDPGGARWRAAGGREDAGGLDGCIPHANGEGDGVAVGFGGQEGFEGEIAATVGSEALVVDPDIGEPVGGTEGDDGLAAGRRRGDIQFAAVPKEGGAGGWAVEDDLGVYRRFDLGVEVDVAQVGRVCDGELPRTLDANAARMSHVLIP